MLQPPSRTSGARDYTEVELAALRWVAQTRPADLPLADVQATIGTDESAHERGATLVRRLLVIEQRYRELSATLAQLQALRASTRRELDVLISGTLADGAVSVR